MITGYEMHSLTNIKIYTFFNSSENNLTLHFKEHLENRKTTEKANKAYSWFFQKIDITDKYVL